MRARFPFLPNHYNVRTASADLMNLLREKYAQSPLGPVLIINMKYQRFSSNVGVIGLASKSRDSSANKRIRIVTRPRANEAIRMLTSCETEPRLSRVNQRRRAGATGNKFSNVT